MIKGLKLVQPFTLVYMDYIGYITLIAFLCYLPMFTCHLRKCYKCNIDVELKLIVINIDIGQ